MYYNMRKKDEIEFDVEDLHFSLKLISNIVHTLNDVFL